MSLPERIRSVVRRVRREGMGFLPGALYARGMLLLHRDVLRREQTRRARELAAYQAWQQEAADSAPLDTAKTLSFLIPTYNTRPEFLSALADSLLGQSCPRWQACLYDGASPDPDTRRALQALAERDSRFTVCLGSRNEGISGNTNAAFRLAMGEVIALCDHDDTLAPDAVRCILAAAEQGADFIYTDEDKLTEDGTESFGPHCKPDFSPDALRSGNYICHLTAMTRELAETVMVQGELLRPAFDGSQDHDLALRAAEKARHIVHIPRILYHWRQLNASFSHQKAERCALAASAAVTEHLRRLSIPAKVSMEGLRPRIWYAVPQGARVTAVVIGKGAVPAMDAEILRIDEYTQVPEAVNRAQGDYLLFLHGGMRPLHWPERCDGWLNELLMYAARPDVGCVGSAILDGQRFYRHAGYAVGEDGAFSHHAGQWLYGRSYEMTDRIVRNVTGVSSALMMIRRETYLALGGFGDYASDLRGADLGLKCLQAGLVNVYTPYARMLCRGEMPCLTSAAPGEDLARFRAAWGEHPPERYYSPLFIQDGTMAVDTRSKEDLA